ncbi:hypothetical protein LTR64_000070 [Lithohypha guttulata]|uniref:uncharacterized protein n=1 Tax=Lithohypha guttulata TaxID=1690604 RepID=UPI00315D0172
MWILLIEVVATFLEGGELCTAVCIPFSQNRRQGNLISRFVQVCDLLNDPPQEQVVKIEVENCSNALKVKRDVLATSNATTPSLDDGVFAMSASNNELLDLSDDEDSSHYVEVVVGDVDTGTYKFSVNFDGQVEYAAILGGDGYVYSSDRYVGGPQTFSFNIEEGSSDTVFLSAFTENPVNVSYSASINGSTTSSSTPTPSTSKADRVHLQYRIAMISIISVVGNLVMNSIRNLL